MTIHDSGGPVPASTLSAVDTAIARHRTAYATWIERRDFLELKQRQFDPEHLAETPEEIRAALAAHYTEPAVAEVYFDDLQRSATSAAAEEDAAWLTLRDETPIATADEVLAWGAYVLDHARREDEVVNLRDAFRRACGLLADVRGTPPEGEGRLV